MAARPEPSPFVLHPAPRSVPRVLAVAASFLIALGLVSPGLAGSAPAPSGQRAASVLQDERLDPAEPVFGVTIDDLPRAYVMADLAKAGPVVHDLVGGHRIDVKVDGAKTEAFVDGKPVTGTSTGAWGSWARVHPDTSIWRRAAAAAEAGEPRDGRSIRLAGGRDYRTALGCTFGCEAVEGTMSSRPQEHPGVFVIAGELTNTTTTPVHHVVLLYELVDHHGKVVYREEGFNRGAETLAETEQQARDAAAPVVVPIAPGASDTYRMIFLDRELPPFDHTRVVVSRVY